MVNEEPLSPIAGKSDHETLIFSLYVCEEKQKEQEQELKYDLSWWCEMSSFLFYFLCRYLFCVTPYFMFKWVEFSYTHILHLMLFQNGSMTTGH